jgi:hypothetical protein
VQRRRRKLRRRGGLTRGLRGWVGRRHGVNGELRAEIAESRRTKWTTRIGETRRVGAQRQRQRVGLAGRVVRSRGRDQPDRWRVPVVARDRVKRADVGRGGRRERSADQGAQCGARDRHGDRGAGSRRVRSRMV